MVLKNLPKKTLNFIFICNRFKSNSSKILGVTVVYTPEGVTNELFKEGLEKFPAPGEILGSNKKSRW